MCFQTREKVKYKYKYFCYDNMVYLHSSILFQLSYLLYPTQRVAKGIMFLTRPSVSQSVLFFLVSATPQNFVKLCSYDSEGHNVYMRISTGNFDSIFSLGVTPFLNLEIWPKWKILLKTDCQRNSSEIAQTDFVKHCSC